jgi:hypothetical protein
MDRLIEPVIGVPSGAFEREDEDEQDDEPERTVHREKPAPAPALDLHPFIQGLLKTLPEPGTNWSIEGRSKWLQAAANIFDLMYKGTGSIEIKAKANDELTMGREASYGIGEPSG